MENFLLHILLYTCWWFLHVTPCHVTPLKGKNFHGSFKSVCMTYLYVISCGSDVTTGTLNCFINACAMNWRRHRTIRKVWVCDLTAFSSLNKVVDTALSQSLVFARSQHRSLEWVLEFLPFGRPDTRTVNEDEWHGKSSAQREEPSYPQLNGIIRISQWLATVGLLKLLILPGSSSSFLLKDPVWTTKKRKRKYVRFRKNVFHFNTSLNIITI